MVQVLKQCGDNLTRENIMKQAASLKDFRTEVLLPSIKINTSATNFAPISQLQLMQFKGERWVLFGDIVSGYDGCRALWRFDRADVGVRESAGLGGDVIVPAGLADRL
jgi:hypothetical protein